MEQFPQCVASVATAAQLAPHNIVPAEQVALHIPLSQTWPEPHGLLQPPQWVASLAVFAQVAPHMVRPIAQCWVFEPPSGLSPTATLPTQPAATHIRIPDQAASLERFMDRNPLLNGRERLRAARRSNIT